MSASAGPLGATRDRQAAHDHTSLDPELTDSSTSCHPRSSRSEPRRDKLVGGPLVLPSGTLLRAGGSQDETDQLLASLQPACLPLMRSLASPGCTSADLERGLEGLVTAVQNVTGAPNHSVLEYTLFPVTTAASHARCNLRAAELAMRGIVGCVSKFGPCEPEMFWRLVYQLELLLSKSTGELKCELLRVPGVSQEEFHLQLIAALRTLLHTSSCPAEEEHRNSVGHLVAMSLQWLSKHTSVALGEAAANFLEDICMLGRASIEPFFPGMVSALSKALAARSNRPAPVTVALLQCWSVLLRCVMGAIKAAAPQQLDPMAAIRAAVGHITLESDADDATRHTQLQLQQFILHAIPPQLGSDNTAVRLAVVEASGAVLCACGLNLGKAASPLVDTIISGLADITAEVKTAAGNQLARVDSGSGTFGRELLNGALRRSLIALPRVMCGAAADKDKIIAAQRVAGCLASVPRESITAMCLSHTKLLATGLLAALALSPLPRDTPGAGIEMLALDQEPAPFRWPYRHYVDPSVERGVLAMLASLGRAAVLVPVLDYLLELAAQAAGTEAAAAMLVLSGVLVGAAEQLAGAASTVRAMGALVLDAMLGRFTDESVLVQCAAAHAMGKLASVMGSGFKSLEIKPLYGLLGLLGSGHWAVSTCARGALWSVAVALGVDGGPPEMLELHSDRLADVLSQRMMSIDLNPQAPQVLRSVVQICKPGAAMTRMCEDALEATMSVLAAQHGTGRAAEMLSIVNSMLRALQQDTTSQNESQPATEQAAAAEGLEEEEEIPTSAVHRIAMSVLDECHVLLATSNPVVAVGAIECVLLALQCLEGRLPELRPIAHRVWPRILWWLRLHRRSGSAEAAKVPTVLQAVRLLSALIDHTGDFLAHRFFEAGFAVVRDLGSFELLNVQAPLVWPAAHTFGYRIKFEVLKLLLRIANTEQFAERNAFEMGAIAVPYLCSTAPPELCHAAECVLQALETHGEGDAVWLLLCQVSQHEIKSPEKSLKEYTHQSDF